jgi:signal transduction histidine kinase
MKSLCAILTALFFCQIVFAQNNFKAKSDSLEEALTQTTDPLSKAHILEKLSSHWESKNYATSLVYIKEAIRYAQKSGDKNTIIGEMYALAFAYMSVGDAPQSIEVLHQLLSLTKDKEPESYGLALAFISFNYMQQGDYNNALNYAYKAEAINQQVIKTKGQLQDKRTYYGRLQNMSEIFEKMNRLDSAYYYSRQAYQSVQKPLPAGAEIFGWTNRLIYGKVLQKLHQDKEAYKVLIEARLAAQGIDSQIGIQSVELVMATLFRQQKRIDSAFVYATRVFEQAQISTNYQTASEAGFLLRDMYKTQNNSTKALYYFEKATAAQDSITSSEKTRQVQILTFEAERKEQEVQAQEAAYKSQMRQYGLVAGLLMFLIVALLLYRNKKQVETLNGDLEHKVEQRTAELQNALDEVKTAFGKGQTTERKRVSADLHDEIGSALSTIAIFSDLAKRKAQQIAPELTDEISRIGIKSREMVQTMRDTIWTLNDDSQQSLWERMYNYGQETLSAKGIEFNWQIPLEEAFTLPFDVKRNLFLAYKEALNNILKHAEASITNVKFEIKNEKLVFQIQDNGKGFDLQNVHNQGNGLRNFRERMAEIGGSVEIESEVGKGTTLIFKVPNNRD